MWKERRLKELRTNRERLRAIIDRTYAELAGVQAEIAILERSDEPSTQALTDHIVELLRAADSPLSPIQLHSQLRERTTPPTINKVTATLNYLCKKDRIRKIGRGRYVAD